MPPAGDGAAGISTELEAEETRLSSMVHLRFRLGQETGNIANRLRQLILFRNRKRRQPLIDSRKRSFIDGSQVLCSFRRQVQFNLPPLRERGEDILILAEHFMKIFRAALGKSTTGFAAAARHKLQSHRWPGNVRELRNVVERALILEAGQEIQPGSLPDFAVEARLQKGPTLTVAPDESLDLALERLERELIQNVLEQNNFNLTRASERLRLSRHSLRYRMQRLNMRTATDGGDSTLAPE